jgi:hypothetical protein
VLLLPLSRVHSSSLTGKHLCVHTHIYIYIHTHTHTYTHAHTTTSHYMTPLFWLCSCVSVYFANRIHHRIMYVICRLVGGSEASCGELEGTTGRGGSTPSHCNGKHPTECTCTDHSAPRAIWYAVLSCLSPWLCGCESVWCESE